MGYSYSEKKVTRTQLAFELPLDAQAFGQIIAHIEQHPEYLANKEYGDVFTVTADEENLYINFLEHDEKDS